MPILRYIRESKPVIYVGGFAAGLSFLSSVDGAALPQEKYITVGKYTIQENHIDTLELLTGIRNDVIEILHNNETERKDDFHKFGKYQSPAGKGYRDLIPEIRKADTDKDFVLTSQELKDRFIEVRDTELKRDQR